MNVVNYVINSLAWTVAGFCLGLITAAIMRRSVQEDDPIPGGRRISASLLGIVLIIMSLFGAVLAINSEVQGRQREQCIETWAAAYTARAQTLSDLAAERQDALDRLVRTVPTRDQTAFQKALDAYLKASDNYRRQAEQHDIPVPGLRC